MTSHRNEDGVATLELALVLPVLLLVVLGGITFGLVLTTNHTLNAAAHEGARAAVAATTSVDAVATAQDAAEAQLAALGGRADAAEVVVPQVGACSAPASASCITVTVTYPWAEAALIPDFFGLVTPDVLSARSTVQLSLDQ